jgi:hypothetical protein
MRCKNQGLSILQYTRNLDYYFFLQMAEAADSRRHVIALISANAVWDYFRLADHPARTLYGVDLGWSAFCRVCER